MIRVCDLCSNMQRLIFQKPLNQTTLRGFLNINVHEQRYFPTVLRSLHARNECWVYVKFEDDDWTIVQATLIRGGRLQLKIGAMFRDKNLQKGDIILCKQWLHYENFLWFTFERKKNEQPAVEENAPEVGQNAQPEVEENAPEVEENAPEVEENAPEVEENAPEVGQNAQANSKQNAQANSKQNAQANSKQKAVQIGQLYALTRFGFVVDADAETQAPENAPMASEVDACSILSMPPRSDDPVAYAAAITGNGIDITFRVFRDASQEHSELYLEFQHERDILHKLYSEAECHYRKEMYTTKVLVHRFPCAYRYVVIKREIDMKPSGKSYTMREWILKEKDFRVIPQPLPGTRCLFTDDILADINPVVVEASAPDTRAANLVLDLKAAFNKDLKDMLYGHSPRFLFPLQLSTALTPDSVRMMFECFAPFYMDDCVMRMRYQLRMCNNSTKSGLSKMVPTNKQTVRPGTARPGLFQSELFHIRRCNITNFRYQLYIQNAAGAQVFQECYWTSVDPAELLPEIEGKTTTHCMCFQRALCYPRERTGFVDFRAIAEQDEIVGCL